MTSLKPNYITNKIYYTIGNNFAVWKENNSNNNNNNNNNNDNDNK